MLRIILVIVFTIFSAIGICDLLHCIWQLILTPKSRPKTVFFLHLDGKNDYSSLLWLDDKVKWYGKNFAEQVIAVKSDNTTDDVIDSFNSGLIRFIDKEDISEF